jgi:hypothetical protein
MTPDWRKSSYSGNGINCVEAGRAPGTVLVRDTKDHGNGPVLRFTPESWTRFTASIKR